MVNTYDASYFYALKPRLKLYSLDGNDLYYQYNSYDGGEQDFNLVYADTEGAISETGTFNFIIEDSNNELTKDHIRNTKAFIELGKTEATLSHFMIGFADIFNTGRPRTGYQEYRVTGFGSQIQFAELLLNTRRAANVQDIDNPTAIISPKYRQNKLIEDSFESGKWRPLNKESIEDLTGMTLDIDPRINAPYTVINLHLQSFWEWLDEICSINGALWYVDYSTGSEVLKVRFKSSLHSGVAIKSGDLRTVSDDATATSFIKDTFGVEDNSTREADVATRLYTLNLIDRAEIASSTTVNGSTNTVFKAIAQQVVIQNDQRRITEIGLVLSKKGDPQSPKNRLNGDIVMDSGDNKPTGKRLAKFSIPLDDIKEQPETIFVTDLDVKVRFLEGENKIWIRIFQRSNGNDVNGDPDGEGDPNHSTDHYVKWHHNGQFATSQGVYSAQASEGDYDKRDTLSWTSTINGPKYAYSIFSNIRRILARTNPTAVQSLRLKEAVEDSSFLSDPITIGQYLSVKLADKSKSKRTIPDYRVTIPNNFLFRPYQLVTFQDGLSGISQDLQVQRVRYVMSGLAGDPQIGALGCEISLSGLYNSLLANCGCS